MKFKSLPTDTSSVCSSRSRRGRQSIPSRMKHSPTRTGMLQAYSREERGTRSLRYPLMGKGIRKDSTLQVRVFVLDKHKKPLMPCSSARARILLSKGKAVVHNLRPFCIRLRDRIGGETQKVMLGIDPGSKVTGLAVVRIDSDDRYLLWGADLIHRGSEIRMKMERRAGHRRFRRSRMWYRAERFSNRTKPKGWIHDERDEVDLRAGKLARRR